MKLKNYGKQGAAFTLIELLALLVVLFLLAVLLMPALAGTRSNTKAAQCTNNLRRLTLGWQMYANDNADKLIANPTWVAGFIDWTTAPDNTNTAKLIDPAQSPLARYVQAADLFKCPADNYLSSGQRASGFSQRVRSVSLNAALGGSPFINNQIVGRTYFAAKKLTELNRPGPASTITMLDEHPDSISDGTFVFVMGLQVSSVQWADLPAGYHAAGSGLSFADGHVEIKRWQDARTLVPVSFLPPFSQLPTPGSPDYVWMNDRMPYK